MYLWGKDTRCLEIILLGIFLIILFSFNACGVRINEIMYNPNSTQGGYTNEWIEIFSNESLNLTIIDKYGNSNRTFNILISEGYTIISKNKTKFLEFWNISATIIELGISLNNEFDELWLYANGSLADYASYNSSIGADGNGNSLQYIGGKWLEAKPTPSFENQIKIGAIPDNSSIYLKLRCEEKIENDKEFEVEIEAFNLKNKSYEIKVYLTFLENETVISETYNSKEEKWSSSIYYSLKIFYEESNKTKVVKLRLNKNYAGFAGKAKIKARIRESNSNTYIAEIEKQIELLNSEKNENFDNPPEKTKNSTIPENETEKIIRLNKKDIKTIKIYKSKMQYIKDYTICGFSLFLLILLISLIAKKKW